MTKRILLSPPSVSPSSSPHPAKRVRSTTAAPPPAPPADACAFLRTTSLAGVDTVLWIIPGRNLFIGRDPSLCHFVLSSPVVSSRHARFFATKTDEGRALACVEDLSSNGTVLNGKPLVTRSAILLEGDVLGPAGVEQEFTVHLVSSPSSSDERATSSTKSDAFASLASRFSLSLSLSLGESAPPRAPPPPAAGQRPQPVLHVGRYTVRTDVVLGSGSFGVVRLAWDAGGGQVACKSIVKSRLQTPDDVRRLRNEIVLGARARHPNVNRVLAAVDDERAGEWHLVLELVTGGDLFTYVEAFSARGRRMGEGECKYLAYQILLGVQYLHGMGVAHRDLKPENILLKHGGSFPTLLICDFGLSTPIPSSRSASSAARPPAPRTANAGPTAIRAPSVVGTVQYFSPEYIQAKVEQELRAKTAAAAGDQGAAGKRKGEGAGRTELDAVKLDVWAVGVISWVMMSGSHPFGTDDGAPVSLASHDGDGDDDEMLSTLERAIQKRGFDGRVLAGEAYPNVALPSYDPSAAAFLSALLDPDPAGRPDARAALALEWMALEPERGLMERVWEARAKGDGRRARGKR